MKKKLDTRFPAARIKKIMQADEDVGKIANAVPLLVSKALELFLQDLCDRTYDITLKRGAKTLNSFHLKQCVQTFNVFDFLKDIVSKVPDLGGSDAAAASADERSATKRRKIAEADDHDSDDDIIQSHTHEITTPASGSGRGRGRGRGRPRGSKGRAVEREQTTSHEKFEDSADITHQRDEKETNFERLEPTDSKISLAGQSPEAPVRNFDLNVDLNETVDSSTIPAEITPSVDMKHEECSGWSEMVEGMAIDPIQLAYLNKTEEVEEDYDEEG